MKRITFIVTLLLISLAAMAQEQLGNGLTIDKTVHNFGDILLDNNFAKGLKDGDTKEEVYLRLFQGITKKDADKEKEKSKAQKNTSGNSNEKK